MAIKKDTDKVTEKNGMSIVDNMDGEKRANNKLDSMIVKLNKIEKRAYDNLKKGEELDMLNDKQKEQLNKLEEKRKQ
tara:strand:+ start:21 stop:251 length:231 start_codon:yes stop_codon:yes gene_type:complete